MPIQGDPNLAQQHIREAVELTADGYQNLYTIRFETPSTGEVLLAFSPNQAVTWQGTNWTKMPCNITDVRRESSGESNRPKFSLGNPNGLFHGYALQGLLDGAEVSQYKVLGQHLQEDRNSFYKRSWRVGRIITLSTTLVVMELREALDGQFFTMPPRAYYPPDFPSVSLT